MEDLMSSKDVIERRIVVSGPSQVVSEQLHVYIPVAGENTPGIARYNTNHFVVQDGLVSISKVPGNLIESIVTNDDGTITINYWKEISEGKNSVTIPLVFVKDDDLVVIRSGLVTTINFDELNWWYNETDGYYYKVISKDVTGYTNSNFFATVEDFVAKVHVNGTDYTDLTASTLDSVFKTSDGTIIIFAANPFAGRILISGSWLLDENKLYTLGYKEDTNELTLRWVDGTEKVFKPFPSTGGVLLGDLQLGPGEFPTEYQNGVEVPKEYRNYKLKLFAPTANPNHGDSQWSVIDILNPGIGNQFLKIGITGGDNHYGQLEFYAGKDNDNKDVHDKIQFTLNNGVVVSSPKAEVLTAVRNSIGKLFQGFAIGTQKVAQIKAVWDEGGSSGLIIKKDGLYQASSSLDNEGVKLATTKAPQFTNGINLLSEDGSEQRIKFSAPSNNVIQFETEYGDVLQITVGSGKMIANGSETDVKLYKHNYTLTLTNPYPGTFSFYNITTDPRFSGFENIFKGRGAGVLNCSGVYNLSSDAGDNAFAYEIYINGNNETFEIRYVSPWVQTNGPQGVSTGTSGTLMMFQDGTITETIQEL